jgi:hypothetical protein
MGRDERPRLIESNRGTDMANVQAKTAAERQAARRERLAAAGGATITLALSKEARRALDKLTRKGETGVDVINALLTAAAKGKR